MDYRDALDGERAEHGVYIADLPRLLVLREFRQALTCSRLSTRLIAARLFGGAHSKRSTLPAARMVPSAALIDAWTSDT